MKIYKFILLHGSWHDGDLWQPVAANLRSMGHEIYTPTLAGHGKNVDKRVSHSGAVDSLQGFIEERSLQDFILVGHSFGGTVISSLADRMPQRIRRLVYLNAFVLQNGETIKSVSPPQYNEMMDSLASHSSDNTVMLPLSLWREAFINDGDLDMAQRTYNLLSPEPYSMITDPVRTPDHARLEIGKSYINATEDIAMPHAEYAWHPRFSSRLGLYRLVQLPGSHEVLFTNPELLATKIVEARRD